MNLVGTPFVLGGFGVCISNYRRAFGVVGLTSIVLVKYQSGSMAELTPDQLELGIANLKVSGEEVLLDCNLNS